MVFIYSHSDEVTIVLQIKCEDSSTGDMFTFDLNDWVAVDEKSDGWREIPVHWPALPQPKGNVSASD